MRTASGKKGTVPICRHGPEGASHKWGLSPFFIRDHRPKRAGRRGRASPTTFGVLAGAGVLVVLILGAWWAGWLPGTGRRQDVSPAVRQPPAAELNIEVAMPLDAAGGSSGPSLSQSLAALSGAAAAKAGPLDDAARFAALAPRDSWGDHRQAAEGRRDEHRHPSKQSGREQVLHPQREISGENRQGEKRAGNDDGDVQEIGP